MAKRKVVEPIENETLKVVELVKESENFDKNQSYKVKMITDHVRLVKGEVYNVAGNLASKLINEKKAQLV